MTIKNIKSGQRLRISAEDWKILQERDLETVGRGVKYSSLYKILDYDDSTPLNEVESAENENVPEVLKISGRREASKVDEAASSSESISEEKDKPERGNGRRNSQ